MVRSVAAYLRVSTEEQKASGLGIGDQEARCRALALSRGWPEPVTYADEGVSGTVAPHKRRAMARLLEDIAAGHVDAVIVRDLGRLGRRTRYVLDLVEGFSLSGVGFASCNEAMDTTTPAGQFILTVLAALAQLERDNTAERVRGALAISGQRTGEKGGKLPYAYVRTPDGLQVDPHAAATVRRIFALRRRGESLRQIADRLNASESSAPRGDVWRHTAVAEILKHRGVYLGGQRGASLMRWPVILGAAA